MKTRITALFLALMLLLTFGGCLPGGESSPAPDAPEASSEAVSAEEETKEELKLHFIDVGQGDSAFIELPDGRCMLVDCGETEYGETVEEYIKNLGYTKIDIFLVTHPHTDHMGCAAYIIEQFEIGQICMPKADSTSYQYEKMLEAISDKGLKIKRAKAGVKLIDQQGLTAELLSPVDETYKDKNDYSSVMLLTYGENRFILTGDATSKVEKQIEDDVSADLVKIGHHGSKESSCEEFTKRVSPDFAIISVGKGNKYGHPTKEAIGRWEAVGAKVLRTDELGDIVAVSDGQQLTVTAGKEYFAAESKDPSSSLSSSEVATEYVLNTSSKKVHSPECPSVGTIAQQNRKDSTETLAKLLADGYTVCGTCNAGEEK